MSDKPNVCVVGAGASGITTCRALSRRGVPFECFDRGDRVGGLWVFGSSTGHSSAYSDLHINVSRERLEFSDWPMPKSHPWFPRHTHIARYYEEYAHHFGLDRSIRLNTSVESARRTADGLWEIELDSGERRLYDALVVANGHHSRPYWPDPPPGEFAGEQFHSHDYRGRERLRDRDVVVVGLGNSACDIAVESSYVGRSTHLSVRRGAHVLPLTLFGKPYDQLPGSEYLLGRGIGVGMASFQIPWRLRQLAFTTGHRMGFGPMDFYGLPNPEHLWGSVHPTQAPHLLERLLHGRIGVKPEIERLEGNSVRFNDGSAVEADTIVWCTGYRIGFPFLEPGLVPVRDNRVDLYRNVFPPGIPSLAFVGLFQAAAGSLMQISEHQGKWVAAFLAGDYALPSVQAMRADIEKRRRLIAKRYVASNRHTMQVEQFDYAWRLERELRAGRRRARRQPPAVQARVSVRHLQPLDGEFEPTGDAGLSYQR